MGLLPFRFFFSDFVATYLGFRLLILIPGPKHQEASFRTLICQDPTA